MLFPAVVGDDQAEVAFARIKNVSGGAFAQGDVVVYDVTAPDGVRASKPATATLSSPVGVCIAAIANSAYGIVQCYGYNSATKVSADQTTGTAAGNILVPVNGVTNLGTLGSAADGKSGFFTAAAAIATVTTGAVGLYKVFIKCM